MAIELYEHNRRAYEAALAMLKGSGKAAVVHPTGTGKSFIGFKLCEDFPEKKVLWLSPSEYIFKTQLANVKASSGYEPENIVFLTYSRLTGMDEEEMGSIGPDVIILDEFHRAGARRWGRSVEKLLKQCPGVPMLGLTATNIRYLDNRRDMASELFEGQVASEMTLGEAIARGILEAPKYISAVYPGGKQLERCEEQVRRVRETGRRAEAERRLEALRRALEKADGLDEIFARHMTDRKGKYIVFCANKEHMDEMMDKSGEWFRKIDREPKLYSFYSEDAGASKSFEAFKADRDNSHLRLLYCIDALNEGIHVDDVSGVILLRPTVSPIVYKQQIGRALTAGKTKEPVIFDIVNNIAGLYSIDTIREEMRSAARYYGELGESRYIVKEHFRVIDEARESRRLFEELEETLSVSWEYMYGEARAYYEENGDLLPLQSYVTENGARLGRWVTAQRTNYRGKKEITGEQAERLEAIGMNWRTLHERQWDEGYELARAYYGAHGELTPAREMPEKLANWLGRQRQKYREGTLTEEQTEKLSAMRMVWEFEDSWERKFELARRYYEEHGDLDIPAGYTTGGENLGAWYSGVRAQYRGGTLTEERRRRLESIGMKWEPVLARNWRRYYECAKRYFEEHGDLNVKAGYVTPEGVKLGAWISGQRYNLKKGRVTDEQKRLLEEIGMSWQRSEDKWEKGYGYAKRYYEEHGDLEIPVGYRTEDGFGLGAWVASQREKYAAGQLGAPQIERLEELTMEWDGPEEAWRRGYEHARAYYDVHGDLDTGGRYVSGDGYRLGEWLTNQRARRRRGRMTGAQREELDSIGMCWDVQGGRWRTGYRHLRAYDAGHGSADVPQDYVCEDGYALGGWVASQRRAYREGRLSEERIQKLEGVGMVWNANTDKWRRGYEHARRYRESGGRVPVPQTYVTADGYPLGEWVRSQERRYRSGALDGEKTKRLAQIGLLAYAAPESDAEQEVS